MDDITRFNKTLSAFNIAARCIKVEKHRHFVSYDLRLEPGTRLGKLERNARELALSLRVKSSFIVKPIPEEGIVRLLATCSDPVVLHFDTMFNAATSPDGLLPFLLGEDEQGNPIWMDMSQNPHLLVAGSTGSGKSVFLHVLIANALRRNDTIMFLLDTKKVEFNHYVNASKQIKQVCNEYESCIETLELLNEIMDARYEYMAKIGIQSLHDKPNLFDKILVIVDEAADLVLYENNKYFERLVAKLAQKARAAGIYMVLATQRPSVDVFTGLIKANFPARIAFRVMSQFDSKVILDRGGAEKLIGKGDAIIHNSVFDMTRLQVAYTNPTKILKSKLGNHGEKFDRERDLYTN